MSKLESRIQLSILAAMPIVVVVSYYIRMGHL